jgi:hypothetical protein
MQRIGRLFSPGYGFRRVNFLYVVLRMLRAK